VLSATSSAVLTELFHLLGDSARDVDFAWAFIHSGAVTVLLIADRDLPDIEALMRKYRDRPMDFADATLVHLAQRVLNAELGPVISTRRVKQQTCYSRDLHRPKIRS
jgi:predicted nucleic acid-binding protein